MELRTKHDDQVGIQPAVGGAGHEMCVFCELPHHGEWSIHKHYSAAKGPPQGRPALAVPLICAEGLSAMLQQAEVEGKIVGIKVCPVAPSVNHLSFADDSLVLMRARNEEVAEMKRILEV